MILFNMFDLKMKFSVRKSQRLLWQRESQMLHQMPHNFSAKGRNK